MGHLRMYLMVGLTVSKSIVAEWSMALSLDPMVAFGVALNFMIRFFLINLRLEYLNFVPYLVERLRTDDLDPVPFLLCRGLGQFV